MQEDTVDEVLDNLIKDYGREMVVSRMLHIMIAAGDYPVNVTRIKELIDEGK